MVTKENIYATGRVIQNHENENARNIGEREARQRSCKRLKLGGRQMYDYYVAKQKL
jgi:hypothetical protein